MNKLRSIEICAGAGGQAIGLERAGFKHEVLIEIDASACDTLRKNRPNWNIIQGDLKDFDASKFLGIDLLAGGIPCPPFSIAGKQLGENDERDLFPEALRLIKQCNPKAIMLENVRGLLSSKFDYYRKAILSELKLLGYDSQWEILNASEFGVSQQRSRAILVGLKSKYFKHFYWPEKVQRTPISVGELLFEEMSSHGWTNANEWKSKARGIAPTIVGGSKKHGGADLGPTRSKKAWAELCVDARGLADTPPINGFNGMPRLTITMAALIQGFPKSWKFAGGKTSAYRQVGNAFPPPVAEAVGKSIFNALSNGK